MPAYGRILEDQGAYQKAEALFREVLTLREEVLGTDHFATARVLNNLAEVLLKQGKAAESVPYLERAQAISHAAVGSKHRISRVIAYNLSQAWRKIERTSTARDPIE